MADRNIYKDDVDFAALALQCPVFNKYLKSNGQLIFSDPEAVQQLTKSLLQRDFGIEIELPADRLCPPVPNRLNYVLWIQDLLDTTTDTYADQYDIERDVVGLDIGTGASCIYPLLGCSQRPRWRFAATDLQDAESTENGQMADIDEKNITYARRNITKNNIQSRIRPLQTKREDHLIPLDALGLERIDFTMCNPPFYSSAAELLALAASKSRPPHSACTGADIEMVTPGGEVAFIGRMIAESEILKGRCQWYTSMLGKYSSVEAVVENLMAAGVANWAIKDLIQGNKTRRWVVAWSWGDMRPTEEVARGTSTLPKHFLPFPAHYIFNVSTTFDSCAQHLNSLLQELDLQWQYRPSLATGIGFAKGNVWSRAARRKQQQKAVSGSETGNGKTKPDEDEPDEAAIGFKIQFRLSTQNEETGSVEVKVRWLQGQDSVLFESFCGMLKRQLA